MPRSETFAKLTFHSLSLTLKSLMRLAKNELCDVRSVSRIIPGT